MSDGQIMTNNDKNQTDNSVEGDHFYVRYLTHHVPFVMKTFDKGYDIIQNEVTGETPYPPVSLLI